MENAPTFAVVSVNDLTEAITSAVQAALQAYDVRPPQPTPCLTGLTFDQARVALRLSSPTLRKLLTTGRLKSVRTGRKWIIPTDAVASFLESAEQ
ncbi:MAG: helix-turn-helix domain-containing protein [Candidatus Kapabacteria bacterium]|nr:MAG: Helix-turn-helix domain protein [Microgenomates bacterium OLB23]MBW7852805.1 helix-turn-helix domain-containing protein [Candidatus Kapabacteria bacterium]